MISVSIRDCRGIQLVPAENLVFEPLTVGRRWSFCLIGESAMVSGSPAVAVTTGCTIVGAAEESGGRESKCFRVVLKLRNVSGTLVSLVVVLCCAETSKISKSRISNFEKKSLFFLHYIEVSCTELGECSLNVSGHATV